MRCLNPWKRIKAKQKTPKKMEINKHNFLFFNLKTTKKMKSSKREKKKETIFLFFVFCFVFFRTTLCGVFAVFAVVFFVCFFFAVIRGRKPLNYQAGGNLA